MLFWIFVIALVVGIVLIILGHKCWDCDKHEWLYYNDDTLFGIGVATTVISAVVLFFMIIFLICEYTTANAYLQKNNERYDALTYKIESGACRDEFGLLNKEIVDEIQEWNEDVIYRKEMENNLWVGVFWADICDELKTIDYEKYAKE